MLENPQATQLPGRWIFEKTMDIFSCSDIIELLDNSKRNIGRREQDSRSSE